MSDVIYPFIKGGAEKRIYDLSKRLVQNGHEVHIFGIKWWKGEKVIEKDGVIFHGVCNPVPLYTKGRRSIGEAVYFSCNLLWYLLKDDFDVVDCTQSPHLHCYAAKVASIVKKFPVIVTWHEAWTTNDYWESYMGPLGILGTVVDIGTRKVADEVIASSNKTKDDLVSMGVEVGKISVVPNGIDFDEIQNIPPSKEEFDIIFVGRMIKGKHVDILLRAVALLAKRFPKIKTGIVGYGPEDMYLKELAAKLDIVNNVRFFGFVNDHRDVMSIMKASKIFVHPSTQEGGPSIVALEANACGLPVIAVNHKMGISSELIVDGYNGFLIERLTPELVAEEVCLILENKKMGKEMRQNAINFARLYDWKRLINLIEDVYFHVSGLRGSKSNMEITAIPVCELEMNHDDVLVNA